MMGSLRRPAEPPTSPTPTDDGGADDRGFSKEPGAAALKGSRCGDGGGAQFSGLINEAGWRNDTRL